MRELDQVVSASSRMRVCLKVLNCKKERDVPGYSWPRDYKTLTWKMRESIIGERPSQQDKEFQNCTKKPNLLV